MFCKILITFQIITAFWIVVMLSFGAFCIPFFWKFDRMFRKQPNIVDFGIPVIAIIFRTISYTICVVIPKRASQERYFKITFDGYDFRANTNKFQKILSYISVFVLYTFGGLISITTMLMLIDWLVH